MREKVLSIIPNNVVIKAMIDLSEISTSSDFYNVLSPLKESKFPDSSRIVFYNSSKLTRTYDDLPADSLIVLQKMLVYLDIPNFFCLVISNDILSSDLNYICINYATNETPIKLICLE